MSRLFNYLYDNSNLLLANRPYGNSVIICAEKNNIFINFANKKLRGYVLQLSVINKQKIDDVDDVDDDSDVDDVDDVDLDILNNLDILNKLTYIAYGNIILYIHDDNNISFIVDKNYNEGLLNLGDINKWNDVYDKYDYNIHISPNTNVVYKKICGANMYIEHRFNFQYTLVHLYNARCWLYSWNAGTIKYYKIE